MLMEKACYMGLIATHNEQDEVHKGIMKMTTDIHNKGSSVSHKKLSDEKFKRVIRIIFGTK
jgi:hypothetical protein